MKKYSIFLKNILACCVLAFSVQGYAAENELITLVDATNATQAAPSETLKESCSKPIEIGNGSNNGL